MPPIDLSRVEPFEICSIRPPTENYSLTFRLTRNCGWNKCLFCPVYKYGARFSRRDLEEIKKDIDRAKLIDDLLAEHGIGGDGSARTNYEEAARFIGKIQASKKKRDGDAQVTTRVNDDHPHSFDHQSRTASDRDGQDDERLAWFASWFKEKPTVEDSIHHVMNWHLDGRETCFLGDSNSLMLSPGFFSEVVAYIQRAFPTLKRFTIYGRTKSAAKRDARDLKAFQEAGLHRVHFGLESGSDRVLHFMHKGVTAAEHREGCLKAREAKLSCCVYVMPGLGGGRWSEEHAEETAKIISEISPDYVRIRSLEIFPGTGLEAALKGGDFVEASEEQMAREIGIMVERIETACEIVSDSASNLLAVNGTLPHDRQRMLAVVNGYLALSRREKLAFSLDSRLRSFWGQYGGMTQDVLVAITPWVTDQGIDVADAPEDEVTKAIKLIRSKLMP